jgi:cytidine deaminase
MTDLIQAALEGQKKAYAPYSKYEVGAAILGEDGEIYSACNVENASFGLSICAERSAMFQMVAAGCLAIEACAVATVDGGAPCGACLQVMQEFARDPQKVSVTMVDAEGRQTRRSLSELLPFPFSSF